ncbi:MAG: dynamin family protein [Xenococcaceae cyanobacterium MO_207.B15]|nr:dynamin family protein [Xenococcaceae cyanobacterium MO_207.B15]
MCNNFEQLLERTLKDLIELGGAIEFLIERYPYQDDLDENFGSDSNENKTIRNIYQDFRKAWGESVERLKNPRLSIAMIGTTSSGKSTIVNSLIGHKIAPIEAQETSAGILTLKHSCTSKSKLVIEQTKNAKWETGEWTDLSDEDLYKTIRDDVMLFYHEKRKTVEDIEAPRITAFVQLLPVSDSKLLELPQKMDVEFIDLPGLKSTTDNENLKVIQQRVKKAFSIVTLDYLQVDDKNRAKLLKELEKVVNYQQSRTDSMIFVLNKVNLRTADNKPLEERIDQLKKEIKDTLSLSELPEIIPFNNSLILYYAQCAWGSMPLSQSSSVEPKIRLEFITSMIKDCLGDILEKTQDNEELDDWVLKLRRDVKSNQPINDEQMRKLLTYALDWSSGKELWNKLRTIVEQCFPQVVLFPALAEVFINYDDLAEQIVVATENRQLMTKNEIQEKQRKIKDSRENLLQSIKDANQKFKSQIQNKIKKLKLINTPREMSDLVRELQEDDIQYFQPLIEIFKEVEGELITSLIIPLREAFKTDKDVNELKEQLIKVINPALADKIASKYVSVSQALSEFTSSGDGFISKEVPKDNIEENEKLREVERNFHSLYILMGKALSKRGGLIIQGKAKEIETTIKSLIDTQKSKLNALLEQELQDHSLKQAINSSFEKKGHNNKYLDLPDEFFNLNVNVIYKEIEKETEIGQKTVTKEVKKCLILREKIKQRIAIIENMEYNVKILPDQETMARQWSEAITEKKQNIWDIISNWMIDSLQQSSSDFETAAQEVIKFTNIILDKQLEELHLDNELNNKNWNEIQNQLTLAKQHWENLKNACNL